MRVGISRVDAGVIGGFERVLARLSRRLRRDGHDVIDLSRKLRPQPRPFGARLSDQVASATHFFQYAALLDDFSQIDARFVDVVVSAHPPSFAVRHPRHLSIFMHHQRTFYDLADAWLAAGFEPADLHARTAAAARRLDALALDGVSAFLAGSEEVARRLEEFNGITRNVSILRAGPSITPGKPWTPPGDLVFCATRQTFPKRAELLLAAMRRLPKVPAVIAGDGNRMPWLRHLHHELWTGSADVDDYGPEALWLNLGVVPADARPAEPGRCRVTLAGYASDAQLRAWYESAGCVVAPAYREDYGLTGVEALAFGRPLIVCSDGGSLTEFVEDGVNGFVVAPDSGALAEAIATVLGDRRLVQSMGQASLQKASEYTWKDAEDTMLSAIQRVAA